MEHYCTEATVVDLECTEAVVTNEKIDEQLKVCKVIAPLDRWIFDTGSSAHFTPHFEVLDNYRPSTKLETVRVANGVVLRIHGWGDVAFSNNDTGQIYIVHDVGYVPNLSSNLISQHALDVNATLVAKLGGGINALFTVDDELICKINWEKNAYLLPWTPIRLNCVNTFTDNMLDHISLRLEHMSLAVDKMSTQQKDVLLWHRRLNHIGETSLSKVFESTHGMPATTEKKKKNGPSVLRAPLGAVTVTPLAARTRSPTDRSSLCTSTSRVGS